MPARWLSVPDKIILRVGEQADAVWSVQLGLSNQKRKSTWPPSIHLQSLNRTPSLASRSIFGVEISAPKQPTSLKPRSRAKDSISQHLASIPRQTRDSITTVGQDDQKVGTFRAALGHCGGSLARGDEETRFVRERSILSPGKLFLPDRPDMADSFILANNMQCGGLSPIVAPVPNAEIR